MNSANTYQPMHFKCPPAAWAAVTVVDTSSLFTPQWKALQLFWQNHTTVSQKTAHLVHVWLSFNAWFNTSARYPWSKCRRSDGVWYKRERQNRLLQLFQGTLPIVSRVVKSTDRNLTLQTNGSWFWKVIPRYRRRGFSHFNRPWVLVPFSYLATRAIVSRLGGAK